MRVKITRPTHVLVRPCEVEVDEAEANRLLTLGVADIVEKREIPEKVEPKKETRKGKK